MMELEEFYQNIGSDADVVIRRMGLTEKHLKKYLKKFLANEEFKELAQAVAGRDYMAVEWHAHTLKGIVSNLGFEHLFVGLQKIVDSVREGRSEEISALFETAAADYDSIILMLSKTDLEEK